MTIPIKKSLSFTERMAGHCEFIEPLLEEVPIPKNDFLNAEISKRRESIEFILTINIDDIDHFINDPKLLAHAEGQVSNFTLGENIRIQNGLFNLFVSPIASSDINTAKEMHYTLFFTDQNNNKLTLYGFKEIKHSEGINLWDETTTLYFYIWTGHTPFENQTQRNIIAKGVLHISVADFLKQITTIKTNSIDTFQEISTIKKFLEAFSSNLWEAYAPFFFSPDSARWNEHTYPLHTTLGVKSKIKESYFFNTSDGIQLLLQRFKEKDCKNIVLLIHGLTSSSDMYIMPEHQNLVNYLLSHQFTDVWTLDWRGSNRYPYNLTPHRFTIDDIVLNDLPAAINELKRHISKDTNIHIIAHCVGSLAVSCALSSGHLNNIKSFISNSVSFTPRVKWQTLLKLIFGPEILEYIFGYPYISPKIPYFPGLGFGRWIYWMERVLRSECKEPSCHMLSFMWGWGFPALFNHKNLHPLTHRRLMDLFGGTSFHYYRHIRKMIFNNEAIPYNYEKLKEKLPASYLQNIKINSLPPTLLMSGTENNVFTGSNKYSFEKIKQIKNDQDITFLELHGYGHQDPFMGKNSHVDVFPFVIDFLNKHCS